MKLSLKKQSRMLWLSVLLCLWRPVVSLPTSFLQSKGEKTEAQQLQDRARTLQAEIAQLAKQASTPEVAKPAAPPASSDGDGSAELAFRLPASPDDAWAQVPAVPVKEIGSQSPKLRPIASNAEKHEETSAQKDMPVKKKALSSLLTTKSRLKQKLPPPEVQQRPHADAGPVVVKFGLFAKNFYGIDLKKNSYVVDVVAQFTWTDERAIKLIPSGADHITLSKKEAARMVWLPGMAITNRNIKAHDMISTAVTINSKGVVSKVERIMANIKNQYILDDYPLDKQDLFIKVASTKYMINEVVLKPSNTGIGAAKDLLEGQSYNFIDAKATAIRDVNGALKKSRGVLTITVERDLDKYAQSHLLPCFLMTCISCGVFYFPFIAPFITPRLALSIISLLQFTYLQLNAAKALPEGSPYNWNDLLNQTVMTLMFCTICLNIFSEGVFHTLKLDEVAKSINHECKVLQPFVAVTSIGTIMATAGPGASLSISTLSALIKTYMTIVYMCFVVYCVMRINTEQIKKRSGEETRKSRRSERKSSKA